MVKTINGVSIVIPAFNEESQIKKSLKTVHNYFRESSKSTIVRRFEIIVVDDGSNDRTAEIVKEFSKTHKNVRLVVNPQNKGKGYSFKKGALKAKYDLVLLTDTDLSAPISEFEKLVKHINNYDIIIGSRALQPETVRIKQGFHRQIAGFLFRSLTMLLFGLDIKDTQCGFKLFKNCKPVFKQLTINGWTFDVELLVIAKKHGKRILEVPVLWYASPQSRLKFFRHVIKMFFELLRIKLNCLTSRYKPLYKPLKYNPPKRFHKKQI